MQPLGGEDVGLDAPDERLQHGAAGADLIGQRRQAQWHALAGIALGLTVQWLVLAVLLEQQHRKQARPGPATRRDVERRRRLADLLAVPAGHLLAHVLDHLPLARDHLQRLGDRLAELPQARATAARAGGRSRDDDTLARQMRWERLARGTLAREGGDCHRLCGGALGGDLVLSGVGLRLLELQLHLLDDARGALRARPVDLALQLGDLELLGRDRRRVVGVPGESGCCNGSESIEIVGKIGGRRIHGLRESQTIAHRSRRVQLSRAFRAECVNRVTPVDARQQVGELCGRDRDRVLLRRT